MAKWKLSIVGIFLSYLLTPIAHAQVAAVPAVPVVPVAPAAPATIPGAPVAAVAPNNLWSFLCKTPEQRAACKDRFCKSPLGKIAQAMGGPASLMSGGLFGNCCPKALPTAEDLAKPADSADGAAARVKKDEAEAKARRESIRYLGTVDCRYWPEAEDALINGLRADRNECVRWEAAIALTRGCCCTKKITEALAISVSGSERDGNPAERSERVREAAAFALSHCVVEERVPETVNEIKEPVKELPREVPVERPISSRDYYQRIALQSRSEINDRARKVLAQSSFVRAGGSNILAAPETRPASNGLAGILAHAFTGPTSGTTTVAEPATSVAPLVKAPEPVAAPAISKIAPTPLVTPVVPTATQGASKTSTPLSVPVMPTSTTQGFSRTTSPTAAPALYTPPTLTPSDVNVIKPATGPSSKAAPVAPATSRVPQTSGATSSRATPSSLSIPVTPATPVTTSARGTAASTPAGERTSLSVPIPPSTAYPASAYSSPAYPSTAYPTAVQTTNYSSSTGTSGSSRALPRVTSGYIQE